MRLREEAADEIDRLMAFLDATEGDTDCEDTDEDAEHDGAEPDNDEEPSLGSVMIWEFHTQARWAAGGSDDREHEHDGREPSLCGNTTGDRNISDCRDLEAQCDDEVGEA